MASRMFPRRLALGAVVLLGASWIGAAEPPGDLWQVSNKMSMEGMPFDMPAQNMKVCAARDAQEPPGAANDERGCTNSNMNRVGDTVTFTSTCTGPPSMTGTGEIIFEGTDAYTGTIKYVTSDGAMTIKLTGKKIGDCDNPA